MAIGLCPIRHAKRLSGSRLIRRFFVEIPARQLHACPRRLFPLPNLWIRIMSENHSHEPKPPFQPNSDNANSINPTPTAASPELILTTRPALPPIQPSAKPSNLKNKIQYDTPFEGTNEVYVQSTAFSKLSGEPPVHHFEGTNEVYVQSSAFDAIQEESACAAPKTNTPPETPPDETTSGIRLSVPSLKKIPKQSIVNDANLIGIIGSGILPTIDIDKSFDAPALDEGVLEKTRELAQPAEQCQNGNAAIYASRLNQQLSTNTDGSQQLPPPGNTGRHNPLPIPDHTSTLHPEDSVGKTTMHAINCQFASEYLFDPRSFSIGLSVIDAEHAHEPAFNALMAAVIDAHDATSPQFIRLNADCDMTLRRVVREFLRRCYEELPSFSCYSPVTPPDGQTLDITTALLSSRIGCFPNDPDHHKSDTIINGAPALLEQSDIQWGLNILLIRFGLEHLVIKQKETDLALLKARNYADIRELLFNIITHDAAKGPVVIILPTPGEDAPSAWHDIIRGLKNINANNIIVLLTGNQRQISQNLPDTEIQNITIPPLSLAETREILQTALAGCHVSTSTIAQMAPLASGRFDLIRRLVIYLKNLNVLIPQIKGQENPALLPAIQTLHSKNIAINDAYYDTLPPEHQKFLRTASVIGDAFYTSDIERILSLEPLQNEQPWQKDPRASWCKNIQKKLCASGELIELHQDPTRGVRYGIVDAAFFQNLMQEKYPHEKKIIHGCYALILDANDGVNNRPPSDALAFHAKSSGNIQKYAECIAKNTVNIINRYETFLADAMLSDAMATVSPDCGNAYAQILRLKIKLCQRSGNFDDAQSFGSKLLRFARFSNQRGTLANDMILHAQSTAFFGENENANILLLAALKIAEELKDDTLIANANFELAKLLIAAGKKGALVNALRHAEKALELQRKHQNLLEIARLQTICAQIYMMRGEPGRAQTAASEAYHAMMVSGNWDKTPQTLILLTESAKALNQTLPMDNIERGFDIVEITHNIPDKFALLCARAKLLMQSIQRQSLKNDMIELSQIVATHKSLAWQTNYELLTAMFDFSRKNFKKTSLSLKRFFECAQQYNSPYLTAQGYRLSAILNLEVYKRNLGTISKEKTEKLHTSATSIFESVGAWHDVAESLRDYADFLKTFARPNDEYEARCRADKVDPYNLFTNNTDRFENKTS